MIGRLDIKDALRLVETHGLAPLARSSNSRPNSMFGSSGAYDRWQLERGGAERRVVDELREHGARVGHDSFGNREVLFAGVRAVSSQGLEQTLKNWRKKAEKRLAAKGDRR